MKDLIDRLETLKVVDAMTPADPTVSDFVRGIACGVALARTYIKQLPSSQPEYKVGKWKDGYNECVCSECNMGFNYTDNCTEAFNYCPNCGAEMKGEEDVIST